MQARKSHLFEEKHHNCFDFPITLELFFGDTYNSYHSVATDGTSMACFTSIQSHLFGLVLQIFPNSRLSWKTLISPCLNIKFTITFFNKTTYFILRGHGNESCNLIGSWRCPISLSLLTGNGNASVSRRVHPFFRCHFS